MGNRSSMNNCAFLQIISMVVGMKRDIIFTIFYVVGQ